MSKARRLLKLAALMSQQHMYEEAISEINRAQSLIEQAFGAGHKNVGPVLIQLADLYKAKGNYKQAAALLETVLTIAEKAFGPAHLNVARVLNNLGAVYYEMGDLVRAETFLSRSLQMREKMLGPDHVDLASPLNGLAIVYEEKGEYARAEALMLKALQLRRKNLKPDDPRVATLLSNLALFYKKHTDYAKAEPLYLEALQIRKNKLGEEHPLVGKLLNNLAELYEAKGDKQRAEPLLKLALDIKEKALGPEHPEVAVTLSNLAALYFKLGDYARAEPLLQRALAIYEKKHGANHPDTIPILGNLSSVYEAKGNIAQAVEYLIRMNDVREHHLALILTTGSERQKSLYLETFTGETDATIDLQARRAPNNLAALRMALTTVLRRKGRVLDALTDQIAALRRRLNPQDRELLDKLLAARSQLAVRELKGSAQDDQTLRDVEIGKLEGEVAKLEEEVSKRSAEFRAGVQPVTIERVQQAIPANAALVELTTYYSTANARAGDRFSALHYVAYVLRREGDPAFVELGEVKPIVDLVRQFRKALANEQSSDVKRAGRALDERVMRPVRKLLGDARLILLSPDSGALSLVPFNALVDENQRYLVEDYTFTYLTSGRDLLRSGAQVQSRQEPVVIANPAFDQTISRPGQSTATANRNTAPNRSIDFTRLKIEPLPGTAAEASALKRLLPEARVLTGAQATEAALKQVAGPRILHIATHGFFLPASTEQQSRALADGSSNASIARRSENPLLRSGLLLAGVNKGQSGAGEDGVLTSLEAASLDLWGTRLVVLSACETGIGDLKSDGVYGLRRALMLAGTESGLISLWQVSDLGTRDLMVGYYRRLRAGEGRAAALRQVQIRMLRTQNWKHPYYWASFIPIGDWRSL
ncbi:MAG TPA: CHAT domain-containing protein [Pyrinomonadaceae bacterium]